MSKKRVLLRKRNIFYFRLEWKVQVSVDDVRRNLMNLGGSSPDWAIRSAAAVELAGCSFSARRHCRCSLLSTRCFRTNPPAPLVRSAPVPIPFARLAEWLRVEFLVCEVEWRAVAWNGIWWWQRVGSLLVQFAAWSAIETTSMMAFASDKFAPMKSDPASSNYVRSNCPSWSERHRPPTWWWWWWIPFDNLVPRMSWPLFRSSELCNLMIWLSNGCLG